MPQIVNRDAQPSKQQTPAKPTAVAKQKSSPGDEPRISVKVVVAALVLTLLLVVYLIHSFVHPFTPQVKTTQKVPPLPGFPDEPPYNVKAWQDMYKQGKTGFISGVPRPPMSAGGAANPSPSGTGTP